jgi:hypothetical protein
MTTTDTLAWLARVCEKVGDCDNCTVGHCFYCRSMDILVKAIGEIDAYCRVAMGHTKTARVSPNEIREIISRAMAEIDDPEGGER